MERGGNRGKRPQYVDLDAPESMDSLVQVSSASGSMPSSTSQGGKKRKSANEKDAGFPPKDYTHFAARVALDFFRTRDDELLHRIFFDKGLHGVLNLQATLQTELEKKLGSSELFNNWYSFEHSTRWLEQQVVTNTSNITHSFENAYRPRRGEELSWRDQEFRDRLVKIQKLVKALTVPGKKPMPWQEKALKSAMDRHMGHGVVWIPSTARVHALSGTIGEGGYATVRKVNISGFEHVPSFVDFAGKTSKAKSIIERREERSIEALVCPVSHPGVVKFWGIHEDTMEAYTLWWNGETVQKFNSSVNSRVSEATEYSRVLHHPHLPLETVQRITAYRLNRAKLAWAIIYIVATIHNGRVLHNDITPSNVLLHFPVDEVETVYIGLCDWGMACRTFEEKGSRYGYATREEMETQRKQRFWVAPELFYVFGPPNSDTSIDRMQRKHLYSRAADAYSVGKVAQMMWKDEPAPDFLKDYMLQSKFHATLEDLTREDPKVRKSVNDVVTTLMGPPYNFPVPEECFRRDI